MRNKYLLIAGFVALVSLLMLAGTVFAETDDHRQTKSAANKIGQDASTISMRSIPFEIDAQTPKPARRIKHHSRPFVVDPAYLQQLEDEANRLGQAIANPDKGAREKTLGSPCRSYQGIISTGWNPPDPHAAVGPEHVVNVVNSSIAVFDKNSGTLLYQVTAENFFAPVNPPSNFIFDPKIVYDPFEKHFVILFLCTDDISKSSYLVGVSQTEDAMGDWWLYDLDAAMIGQIPADTWPDYPGLGFDYSDAVYITSNDWGFSTGFEYSKVRLLKKAELYTGSISGWHDFYSMRYHDFSVAFTIKPAVTLSDAGGEYLLSNIWYGATYTTYWKIEGAGTETPTIMLQPQVNLVAPYSNPPNPPQARSTAVLSPLGPMTQDVFYRNDKLYTAFSQSYNWGSGSVASIRLVGINTTTSSPFLNEVYGADGIHYFFPGIATDYQDRIYLVFSRSSVEDFPSIYYVADYQTNNSAFGLKVGQDYFGSSGVVRWGDYAGICVDPSDRSVWMYHEWATASHNWSTWVGQLPEAVEPATHIAPANGSAIPDTVVTLEWNSAEAADSFLVEVDDHYNFSTPLVSVKITEPTYTPELEYLSGYSYYWRVKSINDCNTTAYTTAWTFSVCGDMHGNADNSIDIDIDDVVFLIHYIFSGGPEPDPYWAGDTDCSREVDIDDAVYLISYIFAGGTPPCGGC
ncbi:MAG: hypothetical protein KKG33_15565 [candidate division Zixibacteria bacterium]|nr:hypothetical protein [candidate division Zixibacteria bacterium]MBU1470014.1 hypothetical protein [candidate division Zixibacteria bacterium]MBU2626968.1 hypothetical protein [candidate division Zixibacteria bacterium]